MAEAILFLPLAYISSLVLDQPFSQLWKLMVSRRKHTFCFLTTLGYSMLYLFIYFYMQLKGKGSAAAHCAWGKKKSFNCFYNWKEI